MVVLSELVNQRGFGEHSGAGVEQLQLAVGDQVANNKGALAHSPEPISALKIGQLASFGDGQAEDFCGAWGFG